ncbi:membrane protein [Arthrobacter phage Reedo]|uniref:Membrane protein n=1 Tax=Arthrobacter phage Reedo TaxID=2910755 RepID=A0AA49GYT9_9CAUD|nr:membrane protein [Arthrobacter phage Reedo]UJQ86813.1 membrane protein [Arthrobacter phage Reedo]
MLEREPLVIRAAIVAAVTALLHVLVVLGVLPIAPEAETAIAGAVDLIGTAVLVVWTRGKVTPTAAPVLTTAQAQNVKIDEGPKHRAGAEESVVG